MYKNHTMQRKRIMRKVGEAAFDLEEMRNFIQASDTSDVEMWQEFILDLDNLISDLGIAKQYADATLAALQADPPTPAKLIEGEQVNNPFAPKHPQAVNPEKNVAKDKQKGG